MKGKIALVVVVILLAIGGFAWTQRGGEKPSEIEYRYATVTKGNLFRSISASGQVVADTKVDVKSKAGGRVVKLAVEEGTVVHKGDLIAVIDPEDTRALYEQASAEVQSSEARASQASQNLQMQAAQAETDVADAQANVDAAKARYERAVLESRRQPALTRSSIANAKAAYETAVASLDRFKQVTVPQMRREAEANLNQARVQRDTAAATLKRQTELADKGFVAGATVDTARSSAEAAISALSIAQQRIDTLSQEIQTLQRSQERQVDQAKAALDQAKVNSSQVQISVISVSEARNNLQAAKVALQRAKDNRMQVAVKRNDVLAAKASTVRSQVSLRNAKVQLDSTTVVAPRDGVVTMKYLEEGTIIPPGTSTFAQGTSLVQISDVTQLYVECAVDEADISNVKVGQAVRIVAEAYPGQPIDGTVTRVNPAAVTEQNITAVKVRVKVLPGSGIPVVPGMNTTCEFITMEKKGVLIAPSQAVKQEGAGKATVRIKGSDKTKPATVSVSIGETGNDGIEVLSGLKEGDEVVTAEIDLAQMREVQKKMLEAQQGGGLAGGAPGRGPGSSRPGGGRSGGGRSGGSGGGGGGGRPR